MRSAQADVEWGDQMGVVPEPTGVMTTAMEPYAQMQACTEKESRNNKYNGGPRIWRGISSKVRPQRQRHLGRTQR